MERTTQENIGPCECCGQAACCPDPPALLIATIVVLTGGPCTISPNLDGHETELNLIDEDTTWENGDADTIPSGCSFLGIDALLCLEDDENPGTYRITVAGVTPTTAEDSTTCDPFYLEFGPFSANSECCTGPENPGITFNIVITEAP